MVSIPMLQSNSRWWSGAAWRSAGGRPAFGREVATAAGAQAAQADVASAAMQQGWGSSQQPISPAAGALPACHSKARANMTKHHRRALQNIAEV